MVNDRYISLPQYRQSYSDKNPFLVPVRKDKSYLDVLRLYTEGMGVRHDDVYFHSTNSTLP